MLPRSSQILHLFLSPRPEFLVRSASTPVRSRGVARLVEFKGWGSPARRRRVAGLMPLGGIYLEETNKILESLSLGRHFFCGTRQFFRGRRVSLGYLIHVGHSAVHLCYTSGLLT